MRVLFVDGDLRYLTIGDVEIVRRIYMAVRDLNWGTLPGRTVDLDIVDRADSFRVTYRRRHTVGDIDFAWTATIEGNPDGTIVYRMDGEALADFPYAKIGLCVHHPIDGFAGQPFTGMAEKGEVKGLLPDTIGPQIHVDGIDLPLFDPVRRLSLSHVHGGSVHFAFEGDLWEMEDQRNWTDASYKSASTPAVLGYRHDIAAGGTIRQSVTVSSDGFTETRRTAPATTTVTTGTPVTTTLTIGSLADRRVPPVGLGLAAGELPLHRKAVEALRLLSPRHLRLDLHLENDWREALDQGRRAALTLQCDMELAVFLGEDDGKDLAELAAGLDGTDIRRVLVFHGREEATSWKTIERARAALEDAVHGAPFVGGTNIYFNELNRHRIPPGPADGLVWSINPQIHAFDELSLMENLTAQPETVRTARVFSDDAALFVGPVTLRPRFNAVAVTDEVTGGMPWNVDPRQPSLFAAAWTLGSVAALTPCGLGAVTYYETVGPGGVMEGPAGSRYPESFASSANAVYPLFHVLADATEITGWPLRQATTTDPLSTAAMVAEEAGNVHVLLANLTDRDQVVRIGGLPEGATTLRVLDETTAARAIADPAAFRRHREVLPRDGSETTARLRAYATARIEVHAS